MTILVCNASRARLYRTRPDDEPEFLREFGHAASRKHTGDLMADRAGQARDAPAGGVRAAYAPHTDAHELEAEKFASELGHVIIGEVGSPVFLIAPPHFLGLLRAELKAQPDRWIEGSLAKDYTQLADRALFKVLKGAVVGV